ncbi:phosphoribosylglycinamide formyltransferase [Chloroflexota bacterium]
MRKKHQSADSLLQPEEQDKKEAWLAVYKIGWFSTGRGKSARTLLETACQSIEKGEVETEIDFVFCSREPGESPETDKFIALVESYGIPLVCLSYKKFRNGRPDNSKSGVLPRWRLEYDRQIMASLRDFHPDLCVLAGYMLIVGKEICSRYNMINLHPAAPGGPAGIWQDVIWQLIEEKAKKTGVMMHLVIPELDKGPVVSYCTFPIVGAPFDSHWQAIKGQGVEEIKKRQGENNPLFKTIREHGFKREIPLILASIKAFSQGNVSIKDGKVIDSQGRAIIGYNLTGEIDKLVKQ